MRGELVRDSEESYHAGLGATVGCEIYHLPRPVALTDTSRA